jgi:uncharacterized protein (UPF0548 family)
MLTFQKPTDDTLRDILLVQSDKDLPYSEVKTTLQYKSKEEFQKDPKFKIYDIDYFKFTLGEGSTCYSRAVEALKHYKHFMLDWVSPYFYGEDYVSEGATIGLLSKQFGMWAFNVCRILYIIEECEEDVSIKRFSFGYGTLPLHLEKGEARFTVEWELRSNVVSYETLSFSTPQHWMVKMGYPLARYAQASFNRGTGEALQKILHTAATLI